MEVTRTSLRSAQQKKSQQPKQIRYAGASEEGRYGDELRGKLSTIGDVRREAPVITAKKVDTVVSQNEQYTRDAVKTAMEKLKNLAVQAGFVKDTSDPVVSPTTSGGGGGGGNKGFFSASDLSGLSTQQLVDRDNQMYGNTFPDGAIGIGSKSTDDFSKNPEYQSTAGDFDKSLYKKQQDKTYEQNRLKEGEKFADRGEREGVNASGFQQANVRGSAFNTGKDESQRPKQTVAALPSDYKETEAKAFLDAKAFQALKDSGLDKTVGGQDAQVNVGSGRLGSFGLGTAGQGAPSGDALKPGSFGISTIKRDDQADRMGGQGGLSLGTTTQRQGGTVKEGIKVAKKESPAVNASSFQQKNVRGVGVSGTGKDESSRPTQVKQTVASLPSNYKQTEAKAFAKSKSYQDSKSKGQAAAKATNTPTKPKAGSFGISEAGRKEAAANRKEAAEKKKAAAEASKRAEAKKKAEAAKKKKAADAKKKAEAKKA